MLRSRSAREKSARPRAIEYYGAELVTVAPTLLAQVAATEEFVARHGYVLIPPFDDGTSSSARARSAWRSLPTQGILPR
jgi:hypothetical protein